MYCNDLNYLRFFTAGTDGLVAWNDQWVSFLDAMLQMSIFGEPVRDLKLPTRIRSLRIDPVQHEQFITTLQDGTKGYISNSDFIFTIIIVTVISICKTRSQAVARIAYRTASQHF